ncbi:MAG: hypothetical protein GTO53_01410 [Planctomycetales bacterium]|nr:hypothetical protein [Planctomycetales bacterium]NIM07829.1 hypothetical protein [Planctomycetales bacterium]NIN07321.1 hypothetical protein [Planctomycetales bacterium]NIN76424.1 hypothetical protein [Planctomycetales bacterium]NIO33622.1 hypothetical protein [Planctomycetales bacterium]
MRERVAAICGFLFVGTILIGGCSSDRGGGRLSLSEQRDEAQAIQDPAQRSEALVNVAKKYVTAADLSGALDCLRKGTEAAQDIPLEQEAAERVRAYMNLAAAWYQAGDQEYCEKAYEEAKDSLEEVDDPAQKTELLIDLALLKIEIEETSDAAEDLESAQEQSEEISDIYVRIEMLSWVAYGHKKLDDQEEARAVMDLAKDLAKEEEAPGDQARLLAVVGREQISSLADEAAGLETLEEAATIARSIEDNAYLQGSVLVDIAENYLKVGQKENTRQLLNEADEISQGKSECKPVLENIEKVRSQL